MGTGRPGWAAPIPELDQTQLRQWAGLFEKRTGMDLTGRWAPLLASGLRSRMRETGYDDYESYFRFVTTRNGTMEWAALVDRLAIHDTEFFRDFPALSLVHEHVSRGSRPDEAIKLWSVGCASGEEPYTLAMVADRALREEADKRYFGVVATDISLAHLDHGRRALYGVDRLTAVPQDMREEYFEEVCEGYLQIAGTLRERVCFAQLNVLETASSPLGGMDVIYCQQLLPYLSEQRRWDVAGLLAGWLKVGGLLVLGMEELPDGSLDGMDRVRQPETLAFRRNA